MTAVLLTGMSGTGKSTVLAALATRGTAVVDTDEPGWSVEVATADGGQEQLWVEPRLRALLDAPRDGVLVVSGCVRNQGLFRDRFAAVVLLSAPREVVLERLRTRTSNTFGTTGEQRERVLRDLEHVEPLLRATATVEVRTDRPLPEVVDEVVAEVDAAARQP